MQRKIIILLAITCLVLAGALGLILMRGQSRPAPIPVDEAQENASQPYRREMDCIDRLLQRRDLSSNDVAPALARCRGRTQPDQNPVGTDAAPPL
jgi:hypothetical protein